MGLADITALETALIDLDFPASKDRIVSCTQQSGAPEDVLTRVPVAAALRRSWSKACFGRR